MKRVFIVSALLLLTSPLNAQIIECIAIEATNIGVQYAKYKSEKLRSANGTVFTNGMTSNLELVCYDLLKMNKKRVSNGLKPSPVTVSDF